MAYVHRVRQVPGTQHRPAGHNRRDTQMDICIKLIFSKTLIPNASNLSVNELKDAIETAMLESNFLNKVAKHAGEKYSRDLPSWDFTRG